jgi:hypothetical protein
MRKGRCLVKRASLVIRRAERRSILTFCIWLSGVTVGSGKVEGNRHGKKERRQGDIFSIIRPRLEWVMGMDCPRLKLVFSNHRAARTRVNATRQHDSQYNRLGYPVDVPLDDYLILWNLIPSGIGQIKR